MMILVNPQAAGGKALSKWRRISSVMPPFEENIDLRFLTPPFDIDGAIADAIAHREFHFVAAGGDGTVHSVLNALMRLPEEVRKHVVLGAAGLGSSNDFHKPLDAARKIDGIPVCMNFSRPAWRDVGRVLITRRTASSIRYFLINASAGITAEGNALFNAPDFLLAHLKRRSTPVAIVCAAIRALVAHQNLPVTLEIRDQLPVRSNLTNLGVVKNPHFSGSLRYDTPANYADGKFQVHVAEDMGLVDRLRLLRALSHGRFHDLVKTRSWSASELTVAAESPFLLELDGEVHSADRAAFTVVPQAIQVCS
jgi:diacylglycerol kinase (ATP)